MTSSCSVTTRDNPNKFGFSSRCSIAWPLFHLSHSIFLLFKHLHSPLCAYLKNKNLLYDRQKSPQANL